jgi:hypothetical protein
MCALNLEDARLTLVSTRTSSILFAQDAESPGVQFASAPCRELQGFLLVTMSWKLFLRATPGQGKLSPCTSVQKDCSALEAIGKYQLHTAYAPARISACDEKASISVSSFHPIYPV